MAINRERAGEERVSHVEVDFFEWKPDRRYDVVFFSFWLSHVPSGRFARFWRLVRDALGEGGRVLFFDTQSFESPHTVKESGREADDCTIKRRLNDGREFRVVKIFYEPAVLEDRMRELGWSMSVEKTERFFLYGWGSAVR